MAVAAGDCAGRLLVGSFILIEPWWTLRTGVVPFWTLFSVCPSVRRLRSYLEGAEPFDHIHLTLFSHGVESAGLASVENWRTVFSFARKSGGFIGVDVSAYPRDFAVLERYHARIPSVIPDRYPMPAPFPVKDFNAYLRKNGEKYGIETVFA